MLESYDREKYELSSDLEATQLLDEIPVELTRSSIERQIMNPLFTDVDFFNSFTERCDYVVNAYEDEDFQRSIKDTKLEMSKFILDKLDERFGFDFELDTIDGNEDLLTQYADVCYRFFILNYKRIVTKYVYKFIKAHRTELFNAYDEKLNKKDVASINAKRLAKEKEYITILSALTDIIKMILSNGCDLEDFIDLSCDADSYEADVLHEMINNGVINGDVINEYLGIILDENDMIFAEIYTKIRTKIINKLSKE